MSYSSVAAMNAAQNVGAAGLGGLIGGGVQGITSSNTISTSAYQNPFMTEGQHIFDCRKVENGWTLNYRGKSYIAADIDSLMDQMKAAMVLERIEK